MNGCYIGFQPPNMIVHTNSCVVAELLLLLAVLLLLHVPALHMLVMMLHFLVPVAYSSWTGLDLPLQQGVRQKPMLGTA
jgi:hypothetical protein